MRSTSVVVLSAAAVLALGGTASAHVTVHGPEAKQDGFAKITFQVPTEKDIPTTKLEIDFPADAPLAFVSVEPHAGWSYVVTKSKLATPVDVEGEKVTETTSRIVWTATAGGIKPGEFDEFNVSAGPLPKADTITFKALQTYRDGSVVRWIESGQDVEHPAPVLHLAPAADTSEHAGMGAATATATAEPMTEAASTASASDSTGRALGGAGLGAGVLGLLLGGAALARTRRA